MAEAKLTYKDKNLKKVLAKIQKRWSSIKKKDDKMVKIMWVHAFKDVMDHFQKEEGPDGKWNPLSIITIKNRKGSGGRILQDTGNMRQSFRPSPYKTTRSELIFFNFAGYSRVHDMGGKSTINGKKIDVPKRSFMWLSEKAMKSLAKDMAEYLEG